MTRRVDSIRLGVWHQGAVYTSTVLLAISGMAWLVFHYWLARPGDFGLAIHPMEPWMLRVHGGAAMFGLIVYGSLMPIHIRRAWAIRRNIYLGIGLLAMMLALTLTGYLLYYAGSEETRPVISLAHWLVGLAVPVLLAWHVILGRAQTRKALANRRHTH